ncbi:MAG: hypothetical protein GY755_25050 [Chloroflexi bacterium]|nr:hypothetical protein [Chloroflexota bacterium]
MRNLTFVCKDLMKSIIKYDLVAIAKRIITNKWHELTNDDRLLAESLDLECFKWMIEREKAYAYYEENQVHWDWTDCDWEVCDK